MLRGIYFIQTFIFKFQQSRGLFHETDNLRLSSLRNLETLGNQRALKNPPWLSYVLNLIWRGGTTGLAQQAFTVVDHSLFFLSLLNMNGSWKLSPSGPNWLSLLASVPFKTHNLTWVPSFTFDRRLYFSLFNKRNHHTNRLVTQNDITTTALISVFI